TYPIRINSRRTQHERPGSRTRVVRRRKLIRIGYVWHSNQLAEEARQVAPTSKTDGRVSVPQVVGAYARVMLRVIAALALVACTPKPPPSPPPPPPPPAEPPPADVTTRYDIIFADNVAGHAVLVRHPDGSLDEEYEFNDRGRGPKTHAHVVTG